MSITFPSAVSITRVRRASPGTSAAKYRRQFMRTDSFDTCICGVVCTFSRKFSPFSVSKHYYIVQYRRKKYVFVPSRLPAAPLLLCAVVVDLSLLQHIFEVFPSTFSRVTIQFRRVTTELCNFDAKQSNLCCFDGFCTLVA